MFKIICYSFFYCFLKILFRNRVLKWECFFPNRLSRFLKNGHLPVMLHSSAPNCIKRHHPSIVAWRSFKVLARFMDLSSTCKRSLLKSSRGEDVSLLIRLPSARSSSEKPGLGRVKDCYNFGAFKPTTVFSVSQKSKRQS